MLLKNIEVTVFELDDNGTFDTIGDVNQLTSLIWPDKFNGYSTFELCAPITPENKFLLKKGHILWCGGDNACVIEIIQCDKNDNGQKTYKVKGRTLECILTTRIIWGTYKCSNAYSSTAMYEIVDKNCINPIDAKRKIPFLECAEDNHIGKMITYQKTGGEVYDAVQSIAQDSELGFDVLFRPREKKLIFKVTQGTDRTLMPTPSDNSSLVVISSDFDDILTSSYYTNDQDIKNIAYVAGEGEGADRVHTISGNNESIGLARKEMYVDARDLQSEVSSEEGSEKISDGEYIAMLNNRGNEKLAERVKIESFEATIRTVGSQYVYGVDYTKGDKVIVRDEELGIQVAVKISEVTENYSDKYELDITFGYSYPTIFEKIKQQIL